jgi:hypothetical protein
MNLSQNVQRLVWPQLVSTALSQVQLVNMNVTDVWGSSDRIVKSDELTT